MVLLGGALKRRESLSARLGDVLSHMYMLSAALKRFEDDGRPDTDVPFLTWAAHHSLYEIQTALDGVLAVVLLVIVWLRFRYLYSVDGSCGYILFS